MKKQVKRFLSVLLVSLLLSQEVLADVTAPELPAGSAASMATASDAIEEDGEPFYYDEDGNKVYDSDIDWPQYRTEPDYSDILWTFEEYPETMMTNGEASTYVVGVDDAALVAIFVAACAACGYYISRSDAVEMISKGFEPWLRRVKGASAEAMTVWQTLFALKPGSTFGGMRIFVRLVKEYLDTLKIDSGAITVPMNSSTWTVTSPLPDWNKNFGDQYFPIENSYVSLDSGITYITWAFSLSGINSLVGGYVDYKNNDGSYNVKLCTSLTSSFYLHYTKIYNTLTDGYWESTKSYTKSNYTPDIPLDFIYSLTVPVFANKAAYESWKEFGTTGGLLNGNADDFLTINTANQWTDLQQDFFNKYTCSDVLKLPETQAEFDALIDSLANVQTGADVITNLKPVWTITESSGGSSVTPVVAYISLSYILDAIAAYAGVSTLTAEQRNGFLADYFHASASGLTIDQLNTYAQTIVKGQVSITGTAEDNDANTFVITSGLASSFLSYLLSIGLIDTIPEVKAGTQLKTNVKVEAKIDTGTTTPPGGTTDLTGVLGLLTSILSTLGGLPGLIASEIIKALASSAFATGVTLNLDTIRSSLSNIAQWDFADWTTALGAAVLLALKTFAIDFRLDGLVDVLDSIARWDFADWDTAIGSAIQAALTALGFDKVVGLADVLRGWDFADWSSVFRSVLDAALAASGLAGLAGILTDILAKLKDLGITIDLSPLIDSLTGLKDSVLSIPGLITDFFTIDMAAVEAAAVAVQEAFADRFGGIKQLSGVFKKSYSLGMEVPVITMPVPEFLKFAYPDTDEIIILDLRPYQTQLFLARSVLLAMIWVMFAKWLLDQFDVKLHVG